VVRHKRILLTSVTLAAAFSGAALTPAAGDERVTGASAEQLSYTKDGVPIIHSGPECKAAKRAHAQPEASDF
jgi:hypothetical protein